MANRLLDLIMLDSPSAKTITVRLRMSKEQVGQLDAIVDSLDGATRSSVIRALIRQEHDRRKKGKRNV